MANILLIEPDVVLAETYALGLSKYAHRVRNVTNAQAAIDAADDETPDIILLELQLVSHSGIEFLYELRSYPEWQFLPVVILSTVPAAEFAASSEVLRHYLGVNMYHYKPYTTLRKLSQSVENALLIST